MCSSKSSSAIVRAYVARAAGWRRHWIGLGVLPGFARHGKQADVVLHDGVPRIYRGLPFADQVLQANRVAGIIGRDHSGM